MAIRAALNDYPIRNSGYKTIFKKSFHEWEKAKFAKLYGKCCAIQPRVLSSHFMRTVPGFVEMRLQKFQAKSTAVKLCNLEDAVEVGCKKLQRL